MPSLAIVSTASNRVSKYQRFPDVAAANAHVAQHGGFVVDPDPGGNILDYTVSGNTLVPDPRPPPPDNRPQLPDAAGNSIPALRAEVQGIIDALKTAGILQS